MTVKAPSYLLLRNGIYYFQARVPKCLQGKHSTALVRRSTRTGNRTEALKLARRWAVELMATNDKDILAAIDRDADLRNNEYALGRSIHAQLDKIDPEDGLEIDAFVEGLTPNEHKALNYFIERSGASNSSIKLLQNQSPSISVASYPHHLSYILEKYIEFHTHPKLIWAQKTADKFQNQLNFFIHIVGDLKGSQLTKGLLRDQYASILHKVPAHINNKAQRYMPAGKRLSIEEIIKIADETNDVRIGPSTILDYVKNVTTFLRWAANKDYLPAGLENVFHDYRKLADKTDDKIKKFSDEDLIKLFNNPFYEQGLLVKKPHQHWCPLLALFTGARESELCQLHLEDIVKDADSGIWYIKIHREGQRSVKTKSSIRDVPIHRSLVDLGFLHFYARQKERNETMLFPDLKPDKYGHWGREVSRWFNGYSSNNGKVNGYKIKCGVIAKPNEKKDFHSFRHTLINQGKQLHLDGQVMRELTGHSVLKNDVHSSVYEENYNLKTRKRVLDKIVYSIDLDSLYRWPKS